MPKTLFKVGIKDTEAVSVSLMGTLNTVFLTYSFDGLLLKKVVSESIPFNTKTFLILLM